MKYLALLRGINVGGNNLVKMSELRSCLECSGFQKVTTYIQSGNVLFESQIRSAVKLARNIEQALAKALMKDTQVVVVSQPELHSIVTKAPAAFGTEPGIYRYDVIFVKAPLSAQELLSAMSLKEGVDEAFGNNGVLYFKRLISRAGESKLLKLISTPAYKQITVRNWNTTTKLRALMVADDVEADR